jgi:hypothetical protein
MVALLDRCIQVVSVSHSVLSLLLTLLQTIRKRPCRNCLQNRLLPDRGGEIRCRGEAETLSMRNMRTTRDLLLSSRRRDLEQAQPANNPMPNPCADWR